MERITDFLFMKESLLGILFVAGPFLLYSAPVSPLPNFPPPPNPPIATMNIDAVFQEGRRLTSQAAAKQKGTLQSDWPTLYADAIAQYEDVITQVEARLKDPKNPPDKDALGADAYFNLGAVHMILDDYDKAVVALEKSHKLSPIADDRTLTNLGISYLKQKSQPLAKTQLDKAKKVLQQAMDLNPNNTLAQQAFKKAQREFEKLKSKGKVSKAANFS